MVTCKRVRCGLRGAGFTGVYKIQKKLLKYYTTTNSSCKNLQSCVVNLVKIRNQAGVTGNVIADHEAKEAAKKIVTGQPKAPTTISIEDTRKLR